MKMKMKIMALALVVPMAMGISGCGQDEGEGPKLDASSREDLRNTAMQAGLWLEREKGREAAKELDRGLGVYVDEGKEDKVDGLRATRAHEEVKEAGREKIQAMEQRRE